MNPESPIAASDEEAGRCFHCGLPLPSGVDYRVVVDGRQRAMCCPGCKAVAEAIVAGGLADYYRHRSALPESPQQALPPFLDQLALYDAPEVQESFVRREAGEVREASLILEGITCAACVWLNERHVSRLPGVLAMEVNYGTRRARVRWDDSRIHLSQILRAIADIGYTAHPFDPGRHEALYRAERRAALRRLAIAGLSAMQVMMYAVPGYVAGEGEMSAEAALLLRWASLVLTLPAVLYSAAPFFRGALRDLRVRRPGMDVPVALGVAVAFGASCWATFTGQGEVYFDSVSMFVFFLLTGRFLEMQARARAMDAAERLVRLIPAYAMRLAGFPQSREPAQVPVSALAPGEFVLVRPGETLPADGVVAEGESEVDESLLTGESRPVPKAAGDAVTGGSHNLASPLVLRVERVGQDTVLAGIVRLLDRAQAEKPRLAAVADRVAGWFVLGLLGVAAATALGWYAVDASRALWVTVSVLVVSCPCALSLATPAALTAATGRLTELGLLVTRGHAVETLARASHFIFDKTGTLTLGAMRLNGVHPLGGQDAEHCLAIAAGLEQGSEHPLARALLAAASRVAEARQVRNFPGRGIEGVVAGRRCRLGSPAFAAELARTEVPAAPGDDSTDTLVVLADETGLLALFRVGDAPRPDAGDSLQALAGLGVQIALLSGDRPAAAMRAAQALGIEHAEGGLSPEQKLERVRALQEAGAVVAMVGDGINDAPVLAQAQVSIAMGEGTQVAQASADMVLLSGRLAQLAQGVAVARRARRVVAQNLAWAVAYNLLALPAAVLGYVTPWMAGIGMSASSLLVTLNALRLRR